MTGDNLAGADLDALRTTLERAFPFIERTGVKILTMESGHCVLAMPPEPNVNHIGTMYAGALFTLAEMTGGVIFVGTFDVTRYYPIVTDMSIEFRRPATTEIRVEVTIGETEIERITAELEEHGKARYEWTCDLTDADGTVVATTANQYQARAYSLK